MQQMIKLYYKIVNDAYFKIKYGPSPEIWKLGIILVMSLPMNFFYIWILAVTQRQTGIFYELFFIKSIVTNEVTYRIINSLLLKFLPVVLFNYYMILYKKNTKKF